jgi:hypothetical protein
LFVEARVDGSKGDYKVIVDGRQRGGCGPDLDDEDEDDD